MRNPVPVRRLVLRAALLVAVTLAAIVVLGDAGSPLSRWTRLDLGFLTVPAVLCGVLLSFSSIVLLLRSTNLAEHIVWQRLRDGEGPVRVLRLADVLPVTQRMLADMGWAVLGLGLLSSVPELPGVISAHPWAPNVTSMGPYLGGFAPLAKWGIVLLAPFIAARAFAEVRPTAGAVVGFPRARLAAFGAAYILLTDSGALNVAFALDGSWVLLLVGLALSFSYLAELIQRAIAFSPPRHVPRLRTARYVFEGVWGIALFGALASLRSAAESASTDLDGASAGSLDASYLAALYSVTGLQAAAVISSFALIHLAGVVWPTAARILRVPIGHLVSLVFIYTLFSDDGALPVAFEIDVPEIFTALTAAIALSYAATILRNFAKHEVGERYALWTRHGSRVLSSLALAAAGALVIGAGLSHLPVASAGLLDRPEARGFGERSIRLLGELFDSRDLLVWLTFAIVLALCLPWALRGRAPLRYRPVILAVSYCAVGCLAWIAASGLSALGHGFALGGAIVATGMFSLALTQSARYATASPNPALADIANWLVASPARSIAFGAALAFYVLLLRPVVYEVLWFAALYEYIALLALLVVVLMNVMARLRFVANTPAAEPVWTNWYHHRQAIESKPDPRSELADGLRRRFVDHGDWKPLLAYLLDLLYRSDAPLVSMQAVCRSLRRSVVTRSAWSILGRRGRRLKRIAAFDHSLETAAWALASPIPPLSRLGEEELWKEAAEFVSRGTDPEALAVALIVAHCQRGDDLDNAIDRWFPLVDAPDPIPEWLTSPWSQSAARLRAETHRLSLVQGALASLFGDAEQPEPTVSYSLPTATREVDRD